MDPEHDIWNFNKNSEWTNYEEYYKLRSSCTKAWKGLTEEFSIEVGDYIKGFFKRYSNE